MSPPALFTINNSLHLCTAVTRMTSDALWVKFTTVIVAYERRYARSVENSHHIMKDVRILSHLLIISTTVISLKKY